MVNLERGGGLERVKPIFSLERLRRVSTFFNFKVVTHGRIGVLGFPADEKGETPKEGKAQEGRGSLVSLNRLPSFTVTRGERNPEAEYGEERLIKREFLI